MRRTLALALLLLAGCPSAPERPRYVEPASALLGAPTPAAAASASGVIRLRSVDAAAAIERRVLWRLSDVELGYSGEEQWTEAPATYVAQALGRELFEVRGLSRGAGPDAAVLDVVVRRFEEDRREGGHRARVTLTLVLCGADGRGLLERTIEVERVITREQGDEVEAMAAAMGAALDAAARQAADALVAALAAARGSRG